MTNFAKAIVSTLIVFFALTATTAAQTYHIEHYPPKNKGSKGAPKLENALIAIEAPPQFRETMKAAFANLGATNFLAEPTCNVPFTVICGQIAFGEPTNTSSYGSSTGYGRNGGYSSNSSFSGQQRTDEVIASLIPYDPNNPTYHNSIVLGWWSYVAYAGSNNDSINIYSRHGGGGVQTGGMNTFQSADVAAVKNDIARLGGTKNPWTWLGREGNWQRGAKELVAAAFPAPPNAGARAMMQPQPQPAPNTQSAPQPTAPSSASAPGPAASPTVVTMAHPD